MTDTPENTSSGTRLSSKAEAARAERMARQAAALRANLRRRKEQARTRQDSTDSATPTSSEPGAQNRHPTGEDKTCP
ncbi:hypothetical protein [Acetobacter ascendens]|uniref:Uncharacterized protein n=1 Tax=Acetobacter ascendens TaxID=481146 RepID=A0A1D8QXK6_9PROT|nr:hypothetical protein [Acetobacter ascendens]RCL06812.1 hypothetical protein BBA71_06670 [Acetobacter pasteurianus]GCD74060.1 hypothetical protein NBRC3299_0352 [Acetobacter pasteurianus NBRC 3299]AOW47073.1 hypothetical protein A4S02_10210 [Acetobacter ascendens]AOW48331.1 hypothetical protein A4R89_01710 [Acetobacter ascendens]ARW09887.1 hypothetical protein S101447_00785 [Acetobacter ascendens]